MDRLRKIFEKQRALMQSFHVIESSNSVGLIDIAGEGPHDIDDYGFQYAAKHYAWRVIEEVAELWDALNGIGEDSKSDELADVLHFFVEVCLLLDIGPGTLVQKELKADEDLLDAAWSCATHDTYVTIEDMILYFMIDLARAMRHLKSNPWKQRRRTTDRAALHVKLRESFVDFVNMCQILDVSAEELYVAYTDKMDKNLERLRA